MSNQNVSGLNNGFLKIRIYFGILVVGSWFLFYISNSICYGYISVGESGEESNDNSSKQSLLYDSKTYDAVNKGILLLSNLQNEDGSWGTGRANKTGHVGVTAIVGISFLSSGYLPDEGKFSGVLKKAVKYVLGKQQENGLIVSGRTLSAPMYSHAFCTIFLSSLVGHQKNDVGVYKALEKAVKLIIYAQNNSGGWRYTPGTNESDLSVTVCQILALQLAQKVGIDVPSVVFDNALQYVLSCKDEGGGFRYQSDWGHTSLPLTGGALSALTFLDYRDKNIISDSIEFIKLYQPYGKKKLYGHLGYSLMWGALGAKYSGETFWREYYPPVKETLLEGQNEDGSWADESVGDIYGTAMAINILNIALEYLPLYIR